MSDGYAERRVLAMLLIAPERIDEIDLAPDDFEYTSHRDLFRAISEKRTGDLLSLELSDEVAKFALTLEENHAPSNLVPFSRIVAKAAEQRRFARSVSRLRGDPGKRPAL